MRVEIEEAATMDFGLSEKNYNLIKNAGFAIADNGDDSLDNCEIELDTIDDLFKLIATVDRRVVVSKSSIMIYNDYIE